MTQAGRTAGMLTLDVEDWDHANFSQLDSLGEEVATQVRSRHYAMDRNTDSWIRLLSACGARSTCFVLGEFARRYPDAVRRLDQAGHEIASHGDTHDLVYQMDRGRFREFLKRGLGAVGEITGKVPRGFRAPSWSVDPKRTPWLVDELLTQGLRYDSSLFPVRTPLFGHGEAPLRPYWDGQLLRVPVTVLTAGVFRLPFTSGAFFRLAPQWLISGGLRRAHTQGLPLMIVLHPRELDVAHPRLPLKGWEGWVHYARLSTTLPKLASVLGQFEWKSIEETYRAQLDTPGAPLEN